MNRRPDENFLPLSLPEKELPALEAYYRIYRDSEDYILVKAGSAAQALEISGIQSPRRIVRDALYRHNVINLEELNSLESEAGASEKILENGVASSDAAETAISSGQ